MSGTAIVKGEAGPVYRAPRAKTDACVWPPKYSKVVFTFEDVDTDEELEEQWAFTDARRFGRVQLADAAEPETVAPLSALGADPLLAMPTAEVLAPLLLKRKAPIKAVLLDQNGVGSLFLIADIRMLMPLSSTAVLWYWQCVMRSPSFGRADLPPSLQTGWSTKSSTKPVCTLPIHPISSPSMRSLRCTTTSEM